MNNRKALVEKGATGQGFKTDCSDEKRGTECTRQKTNTVDSCTHSIVKSKWVHTGATDYRTRCDAVVLISRFTAMC